MSAIRKVIELEAEISDLKSKLEQRNKQIADLKYRLEKAEEELERASR